MGAAHSRASGGTAAYTTEMALRIYDRPRQVDKLPTHTRIETDRNGCAHAAACPISRQWQIENVRESENAASTRVARALAHSNGRQYQIEELTEFLAARAEHALGKGQLEYFLAIENDSRWVQLASHAVGSIHGCEFEGYG